jgi:hypothetical protein
MYVLALCASKNLQRKFLEKRFHITVINKFSHRHPSFTHIFQIYRSNRNSSKIKMSVQVGQLVPLRQIPLWIQGVLGSGQFGTVFKAVDARYPTQTYAVK